MKCLWAGVSGIIEKNDTTPLARAKIEIFEETGINEREIELLKANERMKIEAAQKLNLIGKIQILNGYNQMRLKIMKPFQS